MTFLQSIILGIIQGATEFIPISSSGHLVLIPHLFGWEIPKQDAFVFNVLVQVATLMAVFIYYAQDFIAISNSLIDSVFKKKNFDEPDSKLGLYLILATIPAGLVGIILNGFIENAFANPLTTAFFLFGTAILLVIAERAGKRKEKSLEHFGWKDALWIGCFQILALFPGISRSGATIAGGMLRDLGRRASARFSFLMAVPIMLAAGSKALFEFVRLPNTTENFPALFVGCIFAAFVGYLSIRWLLNFLSHRSYFTFSIYCVIFASINVVVYFVR
jgi:undecaprenyl-diphosphatase